ncbi:S49 family peptidase [Aestuariivirga sp.]|jgi:hypothetical protein|uniref:S49 family peptidase n=1 Tax=Aestuariivirga sp. TaxID=2650926 RepID=UPI0037834B82
MAGQLLRLSDRLLNTPLLIHPAKAQIILGALSGRIGLEASLFSAEDGMDAPDANHFTGSARRTDGTTSMMRTADGIVIIPVLDTLVNRGAWLDSRSGLTSYEGIAAQLRAAGQDPEVRSVLLDISSPGGEAAGMAGLADLIRSVRQTKPVTAFVNDMAASAAYGIASAANEIVISPGPHPTPSPPSSASLRRCWSGPSRTRRWPEHELAGGRCCCRSAPRPWGRGVSCGAAALLLDRV